MTSRFLPEITGKFDREDWLEIRATKADVERYLEHHIRKSSHTIQEMEEEIKRTISDTVDGMCVIGIPEWHKTKNHAYVLTRYHG